MKYKVGDKVRIKSLDWYNRYTNGTEVNCKYYSFSCHMKKYCGQIMTISIVGGYSYSMIEDDGTYSWTDEMIEGLVEEENNDCGKCGLTRNSVRCLLMDNCPHNKQKNIIELPESYIFKDENGNVINTTKIVLEKKPPKTDDIIKWLREHDMTKYIGVIYSGVCSITFDTEKLIKDIAEMIGDE